ncbi:MAG: tetratricopeptide repeat protein, partial [Elusimicrobiales bacterium]|nr:tetratricopeptide repeat protein [Elusimicrobiales bacterium]
MTGKFMTALLLAAAFAVPAAAGDSDKSALPGFAGKEEVPSSAAPSAAPGAPAPVPGTVTSPAPEYVSEPPAMVIDPSPSDAVVSPAARLSAREAEWAFLKAASAGRDKEIARIVMAQLSGWLASGPLDSTASEAQLLKAELRLRLKGHDGAVVDLLKQLQLYPGSEASEKAAPLFKELVNDKADKKLRPLLLELARPFNKPAKEDRMAMLLGRLAAEAWSDYYDPLVEEFRLFFERFPSYPGRDSLQLALAAMHAGKREHVSSRVEYEKLISMHPSTPLMAGARLALANLLADDLKEYDKAVDAYLDVTVSFPGTPEAWEAYGRLPGLAEKRKKYRLAVDTYEKIIALYPDKPEAFEAYNSAARVLWKRMDKPAEAVAVLVRLADK